MTPTETHPTPRPTTRQNTRRARRRPPKSSTRVRVFASPLGLGKNIAAGLLDVSDSGVRLLLNEALPIGKEFEVRLESPGGVQAKSVAAVVWSVETADGKFCVGANLHKSLTAVEVEAMARGS